MMMNASYSNYKVESREYNFNDNVDILFSVVGGDGKPPILPLREERLTEGVELVYNAKGTGNAAVNKEKKQREAMLLEKLNRLEKKLEKKRSYKGTSKRKKALAMVKELKRQLENSACGISYQRYLDELNQMKSMTPTSKIASTDESSTSSVVSSNSTVNIESKVMKALQTLFDDPELGLGNFDDDTNSDALNNSMNSIDSSTCTNPTADSSLISTFNEDNEAVLGIHRNVEYDEETYVDNKWKNISIEKETFMGKTEVKPIGADNRILVTVTHSDHSLGSMNATDIFEKSSKSVMTGDGEILQKSSKSTNNVRFKDIKPTTDDNIAQAKALVQSAKVLQKNFSNEQENYEPTSVTSKPFSSFDTPSVKPNSSKSVSSIRQMYSVEKYIVVENDRYHLFVSHACPWSHKCLITRALKRLENAISVSYLDCKWDPQPVWNLNPTEIDTDLSFWSIIGKLDEEDHTFDAFRDHHLSNENLKPLRVPVLYDKKQNTIASEKSTEIMKILNYEFNQFSARSKLNLFPAGFQRENDTINKWINEKLHVGIFKCGFATSQEQYDEAIEDVTKALDKANEIVTKRGFLAGQKLTESDILLFVILFRFDEIYRILFKANTRMVTRMPGLLDFMRDIYQVTGIKDVCNMEKIKNEFYAAQGKKQIVPKGCSLVRLIQQNESTI